MYTKINEIRWPKNFSRLINIFYYSFRIWYKWLEDRGAQAPFILALAEGFRGASTPFGGFWPLFWAFGSSLRPMAFCNITNEFLSLSICFWYATCWNWPKMAEIAKIAWTLREIVWNCVNTHAKFFETWNIECPRQYGSNDTSGFPNGLYTAE